MQAPIVFGLHSVHAGRYSGSNTSRPRPRNHVSTVALVGRILHLVPYRSILLAKLLSGFVPTLNLSGRDLSAISKGH